jgi:hypothetical protein
MCNFGFHGLATPIGLKMASAKTRGLTKDMHLRNEEKKPNVLIYTFIIIHNHI